MTAILIASVITNIALAYMLFDTQKMCKGLVDDGFWMIGEITRLEQKLAERSR